MWPQGAAGQPPQDEADLWPRAKDGKLDAEKKLASLARVDPKLLSPLEHRREASQAHLAIIRSRKEVVVRSRAQLITSAERSSLLELVWPSVLRRAFTRR